MFTFVAEESLQADSLFYLCWLIDLAKVDLEENCWICYDTTRTDVGQLISPCNCKGDTSTVHEGCLKKWLLEVCI